MKKSIFIVLLLFPFVAWSQTNDSIKVNPELKTNDTIKVKEAVKVKDTTCTHKFELGISFSPEYSFRKLKADDASKEIKETRDTLEVPKFGYSVGVNLAYRLKKKWKIETGILFSDKGENTKKVSFEDVPYGQKQMYYTYKFHYYYLAIPLKVNYYLLTEKCKVYVTAGISANIYLTEKTTIIQGHDKTDWQKTTTKSDRGFNRMNLAMLVGAGINYKVKDKYELKVEPVYSRSLTSVINAPVKSYLYSFGLSIGIYKNL